MIGRIVWEVDGVLCSVRVEGPLTDDERRPFAMRPNCINCGAPVNPEHESCDFCLTAQRAEVMP